MVLVVYSAVRHVLSQIDHDKRVHIMIQRRCHLILKAETIQIRKYSISNGLTLRVWALGVRDELYVWLGRHPQRCLPRQATSEEKKSNRKPSFPLHRTRKSTTYLPYVPTYLLCCVRASCGVKLFRNPPRASGPPHGAPGCHLTALAHTSLSFSVLGHTAVSAPIPCTFNSIAVVSRCTLSIASRQQRWFRIRGNSRTDLSKT